MRKLSVAFTVAVAIILISSLAWKADAQTSRGAATIPAQSQNFTPIEKAACGPFWGPRCGPFHHWVCGPRGRCWCAQISHLHVPVNGSYRRTMLLAVLGAVAAWGILESVLLASLFTLIEAGGLIAIIVAGLQAQVPLASALALPPLDIATLSGIGYASLLAFFAFIGFEDLANVVEEAKVPHRDIPRAMVLTLVISTVLYVAVAAIAVAAVPVAELAASPAPLSLVFRRLAGVSPATISVIAIVATLNTILAQMTMAARVVYGLARQGDLPGFAGRVHPKTATPLIATALILSL